MKTTSAVEHTKENIVLPTKMSNEELSEYVANESVGILKRLDVLKPYFEELWSRFDKLEKDETIQGCRTRTEFCEKILHRSRRSVQYILHGRTTPKSPPPPEHVPAPVDAVTEFDATEPVATTAYDDVNRDRPTPKEAPTAAPEEAPQSRKKSRKTIPLHKRYRAVQEQYESLKRAYDDVNRSHRSRPTITPSERSLLNAYLYGRIADGHEARLLASGITHDEMKTFRKVARALIPHHLRDKVRNVWGFVAHGVPSDRLLPEHAASLLPESRTAA
jgi:hypothetical protein